jgi:hypothetical protein
MYLIGAIIVIVAIAVIWAYYAKSRATGEVPKPERDDRTRPAADREQTWDPTERYDDGEPPAARG